MRRNFLARSIAHGGSTWQAKRLKRDRVEVVRANARRHIFERIGKHRGEINALYDKLFQSLYEAYKYLLEWGKVAGGAAAAAGDGVLPLWLALPAHLLFVMRIFNGLRYYLRQLNADVDWGRMCGEA